MQLLKLSFSFPFFFFFQNPTNKTTRTKKTTIENNYIKFSRLEYQFKRRERELLTLSLRDRGDIDLPKDWLEKKEERMKSSGILLTLYFFLLKICFGKEF